MVLNISKIVSKDLLKFWLSFIHTYVQRKGHPISIKGLLSFIQSVASVPTVASVQTIASIQSVASVQTIAFIQSVASVQTVGSVQTVTFVQTVGSVQNLALVQRLSTKKIVLLSKCHPISVEGLLPFAGGGKNHNFF